MEENRSNYIKVVHLLSLILLIYILTTSPFYVEFRKGLTPDQVEEMYRGKGVVYVPKYNLFRVQNIRNKASGHSTFPHEVYQWDSETERQNRALIVYTLLAMYLGSGYILFKQK